MSVFVRFSRVSGGISACRRWRICVRCGCVAHIRVCSNPIHRKPVSHPSPAGGASPIWGGSQPFIRPATTNPRRPRCDAGRLPAGKAEAVTDVTRVLDMREWAPAAKFDDFALMCCGRPHLTLSSDPGEFSLIHRAGRIGQVTLSELIVGSDMSMNCGELCDTY